MTYLKNCNPADLTEEFILSKDWDIIELDLAVDPVQLNSYYTVLKTELNHFCFNFNSKEYLKPEIYEKFVTNGQVGNYMGNVDAWSVSWPIERDIPCPSKAQANRDVYTELQGMDHMDFFAAAHPQEKYKFGIMNKLLEKLTEKALRQILIARHPAGLRVLNHVDSNLKKLHIPLYTNNDAVFTFGKNDERVYQMEVGKMYVINPTVPHGTFNGGNTERVHLLSRIDIDYIPEVVGMRGIIE